MVLSKVVGIIAILFFLSGCSIFGGLSDEERAELEAKVAVKTVIVVDEAVNPMLNLIDASIIFYEENGRWPEVNVTPGVGSKFQSYEVRNISENEIVTDFKLKLFNINWNLSLSPTEEFKEEKRIYGGSLYGVSDSGNVNIRLEGINVSRGVSAMEEKEKDKLGRMLLIMGAHSNVEPPKRTKFTPIIETAVSLAAGLVVCTVFDIEPTQCRLN